MEILMLNIVIPSVAEGSLQYKIKAKISHYTRNDNCEVA